MHWCYTKSDSIESLQLQYYAPTTGCSDIIDAPEQLQRPESLSRAVHVAAAACCNCHDHGTIVVHAACSASSSFIALHILNSVPNL